MIARKLLKTAVLLIVAAMVLPIAACSDKPAENITLNISAAASLTDVLEEINSVYMDANPNIKIISNYAASGTLQTQIEQGADCDVFISAAAKQIDNLENKALLLENTRVNVLKNSIALIVRKDTKLELNSFEGLIADDVKLIAVGDPSFVPAGTYSYEALDLLKITDGLKDKLILGSTVRDVLAYVETGNVDAGLVFLTDAVLIDSIKVVAIAPDQINSKIVYPGAVIKASANPDAAIAYLNYLCGAEASAVFEKYGFSPIFE
ncbi:MAG: molybdate ABC transporter substrate-binding protein [Dehalococcoidales bacterium]